MGQYWAMIYLFVEDKHKYKCIISGGTCIRMYKDVMV